MDRELKFVDDHTVSFYKYSGIYKGGKALVKRVVTKKEAEKAMEAIKATIKI